MKISGYRLEENKSWERYLIIIEHYSPGERPWDERDDIILRGFFLVEKTYQQIGDEIGVTRERVRQLIFRQIKRLQHPVSLKKYWDKKKIDQQVIFGTDKES